METDGTERAKQGGKSNRPPMKGSSMIETATQIAHHEIWEMARQDDRQEARRELVNIYARIVKYVAGRMAIGLPHYVEFNDLISAGLLGLIQAIDHFDHERGIKFETYAIPRIRGSILDELRSQDWFPRSLRRKAKQLEEAYSTLETKLGRPATDAEVAKKLEIDLTELDGMVGEVSIATIMSLDADTSGDEGEDRHELDEVVQGRAGGVLEGAADALPDLSTYIYIYIYIYICSYIHI